MGAGNQSQQHLRATAYHFILKESQIVFLHLRATEGPDNAGNALPVEASPPSLLSASCDPTVAPHISALRREMSLRGERVLSSICTGLDWSLCSHPEGLQSHLRGEGETQIHKL